MNLLWINAGLLLPLDKGGKLRTWHLMRQLARRHDISYLSFADQSTTAADVEGMRQVASQVVTIPRTEAAKGTARFPLRSGPVSRGSRSLRHREVSVRRVSTGDLNSCSLLAGSTPSSAISSSRP
jgi:hypothetical protein